MLTFMLVGILLFLCLLITTYRKPGWVLNWVDRLQAQINTPSITGFYFIFIPLLVALSGFLFLLWTMRITDEFFRAYLVRLTPIMIWLTVMGVLTLLLLIGLGYQRKIFFQNIRLALSEFWVCLNHTNLYRLLGISVLLSVLLFGLLYRILPAYRRWFTAEDQFLENFATGLFFLAFVISVFFLIQNRGGRWIDFLIPVAGLLGFLEEISYGIRYFESIPSINPDEKVDAFHDFFKIGFRFLRKQANDPIVYVIAGVFLIVMLIASCFLVQRFLKGRYENPRKTFAPLIFTLISFVFVLISLVFDLDIFHFPEYRFIEELLELSAAFALFFGAISIHQRIIFEDLSTNAG